MSDKYDEKALAVAVRCFKDNDTPEQDAPIIAAALREAAAEAYEDAARWHRKVDGQMGGKPLGNHRLCAEYFEDKFVALRKQQEPSK